MNEYLYTYHGTENYCYPGTDVLRNKFSDIYEWSGELRRQLSFNGKYTPLMKILDEILYGLTDGEMRKQILEISKEIILTGIKTYDAAHVACAVIANCDYFISTDKRLLKYKTSKIKLVNPIDFAIMYEESIYEK